MCIHNIIVLVFRSLFFTPMCAYNTIPPNYIIMLYTCCPWKSLDIKGILVVPDNAWLLHQVKLKYSWLAVAELFQSSLKQEELEFHIKGILVVPDNHEAVTVVTTMYYPCVPYYKHSIQTVWPLTQTWYHNTWPFRYCTSQLSVADLGWFLGFHGAPLSYKMLLLVNIALKPGQRL